MVDSLTLPKANELGFKNEPSTSRVRLHVFERVLNVTAIGSKLMRFLRDEDGLTAVEYAVMLALIAGVCIGAVQALATATGGSFDASANAIVGP